MLNTCSIGRRWKPREGWSRPVLTGERGTLFPTRLLGRVSSCGGFFRWMARSVVSCGHGDDTGEAFLLASVVRFPDRHDRNRGVVPVLPADPCGWPLYWFCGGHGPGETPGPFPNPMVLHSRGCGRVARRRIQLTDLPVEPHRGSRKVLFYSRARVSSSIRWRFLDAGRTAGGMIPPVTGSPGTLGDPRNSRGASCPYPMVE